MSHSPIREDKTCLNCEHIVEQRYCPNCGQENTETRKTFHHLFFHFFEDLTHYENAFWKTIKSLLFKPGSLTKVYLSGKRMSYLAPVRLYIFISFLTFFLLSILPSSERSDKNNVNFTTEKPKSGLTYSWQKSVDSTAKARHRELAATRKDTSSAVIMGYTEKQLDSLQKYGTEDDKMPEFLYRWSKKIHRLNKSYSGKELQEKFFEGMYHNFPKALFIYMPLFAFVLWLFQDKRRWYYFDHGIFTLHYFSFLLLTFLIAGLINCFLGLFGDNTITTLLDALIRFAIIGYGFYYFFPAHHRFYGETRVVTVLKGGLIFFINSILGGLLLVALMVYSFLNIH